MWTNRGKFLVAQAYFRNAGIPANFFIALLKANVVPTPTVNLLSDLVEIDPGNGYSAGGMLINRDAIDFDVLVEDDGAGRGFVQLKDLIWTASGGTLPATGSGARFTALVTDEVVVADRQVIVTSDLGSEYQVSNGQPLTLRDVEYRFQ